MSRRDSPRGNWTPERIALLVKLWHEGVTIRRMGRMLGVTHNSIVGKVHRLGLPNRTSPFDKRPLGPLLATLPIDEPEGDSYPVPVADPARCIWPVGTMGTKTFRWCGKKPMFGKQFCLDHEAMAYTARRVGEALPLPDTERKVR